MKKLLATVLVAGLAFVACQKEYSIENGRSNSLTGAWEFKDSANTLLTGNPTQYYVDDTSNTAAAQMVYTGATANLSATISIEVFFPTGTATTGSFQSANGQVNFLYLFGGGTKFYKVDAFSGQFSTENITVNITEISDTTVTGTFSGVALDSANRLIPIKEGKFSYRTRSVTTPPPPATSVGTLGSAVDTCTGAVVSGTYRKSVALTAANTATLTVNVTTAGTYKITSDTLKGIYFNGTGSFTNTGVQSVVIAGVGTPTDSAAALRFRVRYGTSSCTFLVKIDTAGTVIVVPPTGDYFPLTTNSNWSYNYYNQSGVYLDSAYVRSTGTFRTIASNSYNIFIDDNGDSAFYRKGGGLYYRAENLDDLIGSGGEQQTNFLKDNVPNGSSWADSFNVTFLSLPSKLKVTYTITAKAVPATVSNITYPDVIKVSSVAVISFSGLPLPPNTVGTDEFWYARGVGIIYEKYVDNTTTPSVTEETRLRRSQIF